MGKIFITKKTVDPFLNNVSLLLLFDNNFQDFSNNNFAVTANGNAQISSAQSKFGGESALFDGSGDYLELPSNSAFAFGTGDFTIEFWAYVSNWSSGNIYESRGLGEEGNRVTIYVNSNTFIFYNAGNQITSNSKNSNQWYHVAVCRASGTTRMFINGVQEGGNHTDSTNYGIGINRPLIGAYEEVRADGYFNGYIDDLRITKGVARYTANFTPPDKLPLKSGKLNISKTVFPMTNLLAFWRLEDLTDSSGNGYTLTNNGSVQFVAGKIGTAALGNGQNYLTAPVALNLSNQPYTFSFWINLESFNGNGAIVLIGQYPGFSVSVQGPDLLRLDDFTQSASYVSVGAVPLNTWTHLCITKDASQNVQAYFNGQLDAGTGTTNTDNIANFTLFSAFTYHNYIGRLDALGVWSRVLTINEVKTLYNNGAGLEPFRNGKLNITKPVFPMANLLAFWKLNDTSDSSGNSNNLTNNNGVVFGEPGVVGNGARTTWGNSGSYLTTNLSINGNATLSLWFRYDSLPVANPGGYSDRYPLIFQKYPFCAVVTDSNYPRKLILTDLATWGVTSANEVFTVGQWCHIVTVIENSKAKVYADGVLILETPAQYNNSFESGGRLLGFGGDNVDLATSYGTDTRYDSIGMWNRALTIKEIQTLYNNGEGLEP